MVAQTNNIQVSLGLLKSTQHHYDTLSRPDFNAESGGVIGGSIFPASRDLSTVISAAYFLLMFSIQHDVAGRRTWGVLIVNT